MQLSYQLDEIERAAQYLLDQASTSIIRIDGAMGEVFYHFDFYRLNHPDEALDFGLEEYLESGNLCFLEWAEKVSTHLPLEYDHFVIKEQKDGSRIIEKIKPLKS